MAVFSYNISRQEYKPTGWLKKQLETMELMVPKKYGKKYSIEAWIERQLISQATLSVSA